MRRGTTPTVEVTVTADDGTPLDLTGHEVYVTFKQGATGRSVTKGGGDLDVSSDGEATVVAVPLTQAETLRFRAGRTVRVQLRAKDGQGNAIASDIAELDVGELLMGGEI